MRSGFSIRAGAALIDAVSYAVLSVASAILLVLYYASGFGMGIEDVIHQVRAGQWPLYLVIFCALWCLYFFSEALLGVTCGKLILGLRVGRKDGCRAATTRLVSRFILKRSPELFAWASLFFVWLPWLQSAAVVLSVLVLVTSMLALGEGRMTVYDYIVGTAVYPLNELGAAAETVDPSLPRTIRRPGADPENLYRPRW